MQRFSICNASQLSPALWGMTGMSGFRQGDVRPTLQLQATTLPFWFWSGCSQRSPCVTAIFSPSCSAKISLACIFSEHVCNLEWIMTSTAYKSHLMDSWSSCRLTGWTTCMYSFYLIHHWLTFSYTQRERERESETERDRESDAEMF